MTQNTCVHEVPTVTPQDYMKLNSVAPVLLATSAGQWVSLPLLISATQAISVKRFAHIPHFPIQVIKMQLLIVVHFQQRASKYCDYFVVHEISLMNSGHYNCTLLNPDGCLLFRQNFC